MKVKLANPGNERYRYADIKAGDTVRICAWGRGVYLAKVSRVDAKELVVEGERLGLSANRSRQRLKFPLDSLCYLEKILKGA